MPTFDPSTIDPTKPTTGTALTADVRANEDATQTNLEGAFNDVSALEATAPTTDQKAALDAANLPTALNEFSTAADTDSVQVNLDTHIGNTANPHVVTAAQVGADPSGSAAVVQANLDTHEADLANPHVVTAAQAGAIPLTLTADGELLSYDGAQYTKLGIGLDGQVPVARPGGGVGAKIVWEAAPGGTPSPLTTKGDLYAYSTTDARLPVGTNGQFLSANSAAATGLEYVDPPQGTGDVTSTLNTVDGEVQLGDTTAKGIKGAGFQATDVVLNPMTADLYLDTFRHVVGTSGSELGFFGELAGVAVQLIGSTDGGLTLDIDLTMRGASFSGLGQFLVVFECQSGAIELNASTGVVTGSATPQGQNTLNTEGNMYVDGNPVIDVGQTQTIGEVGYPYTSTAQASGGTFAPTGAGNGKYHLTGTTATTIDPSALGAESQISIYVPSGVAVTISPAPDVLKGTDPGAEIRTLMLERWDVPGASVIATWN